MTVLAWFQVNKDLHEISVEEEHVQGYCDDSFNALFECPYNQDIRWYLHYAAEETMR